VSERNPPPPAGDPIRRYSPAAGLNRAEVGPGRPPARGDSLVDLLDRVLDKGVVVAGDISISLLDIELLTIKIRLLIASVDKAREMGIDWWAHDPQLSAGARQRQQKLDADRENKQLRDRIGELEARLEGLLEDRTGDTGRPRTSSSSALPAAAAAVGRRARSD
jgi:hypothetical protein